MDDLENADRLLELERQIARRADEISRLRGLGDVYPLASWLDAEDEVWSSLGTSPDSGGSAHTMSDAA